jgi:hypothetical protein
MPHDSQRARTKEKAALHRTQEVRPEARVGALVHLVKQTECPTRRACRVAPLSANEHRVFDSGGCLRRLRGRECHVAKTRRERQKHFADRPEHRWWPVATNIAFNRANQDWTYNLPRTIKGLRTTSLEPCGNHASYQGEVGRPTRLQAGPRANDFYTLAWSQARHGCG